MKRVVSILLALAMLIAVMLPVLADSVYSTSYSEQFVMGYSWSTGKTTGVSHSFRVFFKNPAQRSITSYRLSMRFYDADGTLINTDESEWVNKTVASNHGTWTAFVYAPDEATTFTWKLAYHLNNSEKEYSSDWLTVAAPDNDSDLVSRRAWANAKKISVTANSTDPVVNATSFQEKYIFNINSKNGKLTGKNRYFRTYFKNIGDTPILGYEVELNCTVPDTKVPETVTTGHQAVTLGYGKGMWSSWIEMPMSTQTRDMSITYDYVE